MNREAFSDISNLENRNDSDVKDSPTDNLKWEAKRQARNNNKNKKVLAERNDFAENFKTTRVTQNEDSGDKENFSAALSQGHAVIKTPSKKREMKYQSPEDEESKYRSNAELMSNADQSKSPSVTSPQPPGLFSPIDAFDRVDKLFSKIRHNRLQEIETTIADYETHIKVHIYSSLHQLNISI
jgi:hypothetical protein